MNWDRYHGLALPTAPEVLPRVTEKISDLEVLLFISKYQRHERDVLFTRLALQNCAHAWVKIVCSGTEGLPRRDLQGLTDSSLPVSSLPDTPPAQPQTPLQVVWNSRGSPREETEIKYCGFCL